jgi:VCBS repeat-containing protein
LANDTDFDPAVLTAVIDTEPANGTLELNEDGSFTYTPNANFNGTDTFTYKANDGHEDSSAATVTITVTDVKDQVIAVDDKYETDEDTPLTIEAPGVLGNDIDVDLNIMVATLVTDVQNGTLSLKGDGSFVYVPDPDFNGTDSFEYQLVTYPARQSLWTDEAVVTITVHPVNDPPIIEEIGDQTVAAGETLTFTVEATDPEGEELTYSLGDTSPDGATIDPSTGEFSWDTTGVEPGDYTFDICVSDGENTVCETITVTVEAEPGPQPLKYYLPIIFN